MKLLIIGHKYQYEMLKLTQIFYPNTKIDLLFSSADTGDDETVITTSSQKIMLPCRLPSKKAKGSHQTASRKRGRRAVYGIYAFFAALRKHGIYP